MKVLIEIEIAGADGKTTEEIANKICELSNGLNPIPLPEYPGVTLTKYTPIMENAKSVLPKWNWLMFWK